MINKNIKKQLGYTITEMLMVCAVSVIIGGAMFTAARMGNEQSNETDTKMTVQDSAREGMYKMLQEIRQTSPDRVSISNGSNTLTFDVPDPSNPVRDGGGVNWSAAHNVQYSIGGTGNNQLIRRNLTTGASTVMANDVTGVAFSNTNDGNMINVSLSIAKDAYNGRTVPGDWLTLTGEAELRNEDSSQASVAGEDSGSSNNSDSGSSDDSDDDNGSSNNSDNGASDDSDDDNGSSNNSDHGSSDNSDDDNGSSNNSDHGSSDNSDDDNGSSNNSDHGSSDHGSSDDDSNSSSSYSAAEKAKADKKAAEKAAAAAEAAEKAAAEKAAKEAAKNKKK